MNLGCKAAIKSEPFENLENISNWLKTWKRNYRYPMAYVLQSAAGAKAVIGIWSIVLAEMCSEVVGSKRMTFP